MLIGFSVTNHGSIRDEQSISFITANKDDSHQESLIEKSIPGLKDKSVSRVAAIYGANASGKSTVLDALEFAVNFIRTSLIRDNNIQTKIPRKPFALRKNPEQHHSSFVFEFIIDDTLHLYSFTISDKEVISEELIKYNTARKTTLFSRTQNTDIWNKENKLGLTINVQSATRPNTLFLTTAYYLNQESIQPIFRFFDNFDFFHKRDSRTFFGNYLASNNLLRDHPDFLKSFITHADLGITNAELVDDFSILEIIKKHPEDAKNIPEELLKNTQFYHQGENSQEIPLNIRSESEGTLHLFQLAPHFHNAITKQSILIIDELDSSLHPLIAQELVNIFSAKTPGSTSQLIFTTHNTQYLNTDTHLRRDQIWFTQKDECGATELYSLADYKQRKDNDIQSRYLDGRYGAIPHLQDMLPKTSTAQNHE